MKKITIVGGGIAGLVARYVLSKRFPEGEIVLYEKSGRLGGAVETVIEPYFFERGPRTIKASRSPELLQLIEELGLKVVYSSKEAKRRFIYSEGKPRSLLSLLPPLLPSLLKEWWQPYPWCGDETIASFITRRLGTYAAEMFFDPLTLGIFGGDIHQLSMTACFPELKAMEQEHGSLTKGFFKRKKGKGAKGLFSVEGGLQTLIDALAEKGRGEIHLNTAVETLPEGEVVLAVPAPVANGLFKGDPEAEAFFSQIPSVSLTVVNCIFEESISVPKGFGYLVPSKEKDPVLGVVFDSEIFPMGDGKTRLTVMLREGSKEEALDGLRRQLRVTAPPIDIHTKIYPHAVPQYQVGHLERVAAFETHLETHYPQVKCVGNYLRGVSLNSSAKSSLDLKYKTPNVESFCTQP